MMLLSPRQIRIVLDLFNNIHNYTSIDDLANNYQLSKRTIQNDLAAIRQESMKFNVDLDSVPNMGVKFIARDDASLHNLIETAQKTIDSSNEFSSTSSRVGYIISSLINEDDYLKSSDLSEEMYVSQSTVSNDLKHVREILNKYHLTLDSKPSHGIKIVGDEKNMRLCLIKEGIIGKPKLYSLDAFVLRHEESEINIISDIVTRIFLKYEYSISEIVLQNLIVHIHVCILRVKEGHVVQTPKTKLPDKYDTAYEIAQEILMICSTSFDIPYSEAEVIYLTLNIFGKKEFDDEYFISIKTTEIIDDALEKIKHTYHIDLTNEIDLKIALGLHLTPLIIRVENKMQFNNLSTLNIKQMNPLAYNIATDFLSFVFKNYRDFTEDEINYVAIHFINFVENKMSNKDENNVLIISSYRLNDTFLMRQKIIRNIPNINEIKVVNENKWNQMDAKNYSAIITAEKEVSERYDNVKLVDFFLTDNDIKKIENSISGLKDVSHITSKFHPKLFTRCSSKSKKEIVDNMLHLVESNINLGTELSNSVRKHEEITPSSYFGNGIAILHPEEPITSTSFIAVALLNKPVKWDYESEVHTVLLVSIAKDNPKDFSIWNWLSEFISDENFESQQPRITNYTQFINYITKIYNEII